MSNEPKLSRIVAAVAARRMSRSPLLAHIAQTPIGQVLGRAAAEVKRRHSEGRGFTEEEIVDYADEALCLLRAIREHQEAQEPEP